MGYHPLQRNNDLSLFKSVQLIMALLVSSIITAQTKLDLSNLNDFNNPTANWRIGGTVHADINKSHQLSYTQGNGIIPILSMATWILNLIV